MIRFLVVMLLVGGAAWYLWGGSDKSTAPPPPETQLKAQEEKVHAMEQDLQDQAAQQLRDVDAQSQ